MDSLRIIVRMLCLCCSGAFSTELVSGKLYHNEESHNGDECWEGLKDYSQKSIAIDAAEKYQRLHPEARTWSDMSSK